MGEDKRDEIDRLRLQLVAIRNTADAARFSIRATNAPSGPLEALREIVNLAREALR